MAEYIDKDSIVLDYSGLAKISAYDFMSIAEYFANQIKIIPAADVVARCAYNQVAWERDQAIKQLREDYGVGLGEKKSVDVSPVRHGRWIYHDDGVITCSECGNGESRNSHYCRYCGAKMDLEG